jgi:hypothetical protein
LTCVGATDEFCGCKKWKCSNQSQTETPGGNTITSCTVTLYGETLTGYQTSSDCAVGPVSNYYDSATQCCVSRVLSNTCPAGYTVSRTSSFPENTYANYGNSTSDKQKLVTINCSHGYYKDPAGSTPKANSITAASGSGFVSVSDCSGCSTEKCFPSTPASCYTDGKTGCLTQDLDINGNSTIERNEQDIPYEWINCEQSNPGSCGYTAAETFYADYISKYPNNTYKRQKFYIYNSSAKTCDIIWGDISCALPGHLTDGLICSPCPVGTYGTLDKRGAAICEYCAKGYSTFTDSNGDGKIEVSEHTDVAPDNSYCKECPAGHLKTGDFCKPCENAGYYNSKTAQTSTDTKKSICTEKCPVPFTTDINDVNDNINKCYIDSSNNTNTNAIKPKDNLGEIFLWEEIGKDVRLYHQKI